MIIDAHAHVGRMADFNLSQKKLLEAMDRYGIDAAIVSSITGMEVSLSRSCWMIQCRFHRFEGMKNVLSLLADFLTVFGFCCG